MLHIALPIIMFLLAWLLKQNRDAKIQMNKAIDTLTTAVESVKAELQNYRETWIDRREALIGIITSHCTDSQGACRTLVEVQLAGIKQSQEKICQKLDDLKRRRKTRWEKQEDLNHRFIAHMGDKEKHNKSL